MESQFGGRKRYVLALNFFFNSKGFLREQFLINVGGVEWWFFFRNHTLKLFGFATDAVRNATSKIAIIYFLTIDKIICLPLLSFFISFFLLVIR